MTGHPDFATVAHEQRGRTEQRYSEPTEASPRALYSFVGLLFGSLGALIRKWAYPDTPAAVDEAGEQDQHEKISQGPRPPASEAAPDAPLIEERANEADNGTTASNAHIPQSSLVRTDPAPVPITDPTTPPLHVQPLPAPANDNLSLQLPLTAPTSEATSAAAGSSEAGGAPPASGDNVTSKPGGTSDDASDDDVTPDAGRNRAPVISGPVHLGQLYVNTAIVIGLTDLLSHASDPDGDLLRITSLSSNSGTLVDNGDDTWTFTPNDGDESDVQFSYAVSDGTDATPQTALLDLVPEPIVWTFGTPEDDVIVATEGDDYLAALGGSDIVEARGGDDEIDGGDGHDILSGGSGNDFIQGGAGNDIIDGGAGDDVILAGSGDDIVLGGSGDDVISGGDGNDLIEAGRGDDTVDAGEGDDTIRATAGSSGDGDDTYVGGSGIDTYDLAATRTDAQIDLMSGTAASLEIGKDRLVGIENIASGSGNDSIRGNSDGGTVSAGGGNDVVDLEGGDDVVLASIGDGDDYYDGGDGADVYDISSTVADAIIDLEKGAAVSDDIGSDQIENIERVRGGSGSDTFIADTQQNEFTGGAGADTFKFKSVGDSIATPGRWDRITDFEIGDRIDIKDIDADEKSDGKQAFVFKGDHDSYEKAGEIRVKNEMRDDGDHTMVFGNVDDDVDDDFAIDLLGCHVLTADDFVGLG